MLHTKGGNEENREQEESTKISVILILYISM